YDEIGQILTRSAKATSWDGVSWIQETCRVLQIPPLASYGLRRTDFLPVIEKAAVASSMQGNPVKLTPDEMEEILTRAL
ncbi:MAG: alcohol dehydrogenase, partial [candidate division Zixibacteria bacterium]|nr:alcohol dehydrogenase [candidate division Zixibacteria bacterium]